MLGMIAFLSFVLFAIASGDTTISDWQCGYSGVLTDTFKEIYSDTNITGFCTNSVAPVFGAFGITIWVYQGPSFSETDIYSYVATEIGDDDCATFNVWDYEFFYWHDCDYYTGDPSQLSDSFTLGPSTDDQTTVTIEFNCDTSSTCGDITVSCGGSIDLSEHLLDDDKGACDDSNAPVYGTIAVYDENNNDFITEDLHSLVASSTDDDCLDYSNDENYTLYYIHDCNADTSFEEAAATDTFELGIDSGSQISVTIDNDCFTLLEEDATYTCDEDEESSFTNVSSIESIDFDCSNNGATVSSASLSQYNIYFKDSDTHEITIYIRNLEDMSGVGGAPDTTLDINDYEKNHFDIDTLYNSDTFVLAWVQEETDTGDEIDRVVYLLIDPTTNANTYLDDITDADVYYADVNTSDTIRSKRYTGVSGLSDGNFVVVWSQSIDNDYYQILLSIVNPTTNELVITEQLVATDIPFSFGLHPWSVVTSVESGYFMVTWAKYDVNSLEIFEYSRIYSNDGAAATDAFVISLGYSALPSTSKPETMGLKQTVTNEYFLVVTMCTDVVAQDSCIRIFDTNGDAKTINGDTTYFVRGDPDVGFEDYFRRNIYGITELNDGSLMVLYTPASDFLTVGDVFEIEVINDDFSINWDIDRSQIYETQMVSSTRGTPNGDLSGDNDNQFLIVGGLPGEGCVMQLWTYQDSTSLSGSRMIFEVNRIVSVCVFVVTLVCAWLSM